MQPCSFMAGDGDVLRAGLVAVYNRLQLLPESGGGGSTSTLDAADCARNLRMVVYTRPG